MRATEENNLSKHQDDLIQEDEHRYARAEIVEQEVQSGAPSQLGNNEGMTNEQLNNVLRQEEVRERQAEERLCYACGSSKHEIKECESGQNIFITYPDEGTRYSKLEIRRMMGNYGKVTSVKFKKNRWGEDTNSGMICFSTKEEAQYAIQQIREYNGWRAREYYTGRIGRHYDSYGRRSESRQHNAR